MVRSPSMGEMRTSMVKRPTTVRARPIRVGYRQV